MERAYREGKVRALGVSNFYPDRLIDLHQHVEVKPAVNQVEMHVFNQRMEDVEYMVKYGCQVMAWGPFAEGRNGFFTNPVRLEIGKAHGKSAAQVGLRYLLQKKAVVIPKSSHKERMAENIAVFDFELSEKEMDEIKALDLKRPLFNFHRDPVAVERYMELEKLL